MFIYVISFTLHLISINLSHTFIHPQMLSTLIFYLFITTLANSITIPFEQDHILINFGLPKNSPQLIDNPGGTWQSDQDFILTSLSATSNSIAFAVEATTPYNMARIFRTTTTYSIPVTTWGPKLIRLYFPPLSISYDIIDTKSSFLSLTINGFNILRNFSAFAVTTNANAHVNTTRRSCKRDLHLFRRRRRAKGDKPNFLTK